jgi:hypothetical protein
VRREVRRLIGRLRQVSALIFIFVIVVGFFGNYKPAYGINCTIGEFQNTIEGSAPNSASLFRPIVQIFDCTETTKRLIARDNMPKVIGIEWCRRIYSIYSYCEPQATFANWDIRERRRFQIAWQLSVNIKNVKVYTNIIDNGPGVTHIDKQQIHNDGHIWQDRCCKPKIFYSNSRTMRGAELVSGKFESGSGQPPLFRCGTPQGQSEGGDGDCRKRGERSIVLVNERPLTEQEYRDVNTHLQ